MREAEKILKLHHQLIEAEQHAFPVKGTLVNVSTKQGVYIVYSKSEKTLHVGRTISGKDGLDQRLRDHLRNKSSFSKKYLKPKMINLREGGKFRFLEVENDRERALLEALTTGKLCPSHLGTGKTDYD